MGASAEKDGAVAPEVIRTSIAIEIASSGDTFSITVRNVDNGSDLPMVASTEVRHFAGETPADFLIASLARMIGRAGCSLRTVIPVEQWKHLRLNVLSPAMALRAIQHAIADGLDPHVPRMTPHAATIGPATPRENGAADRERPERMDAERSDH